MAKKSGGGGFDGCEWEVTSMVTTDAGREQDKHACGEPVTHLATRDDFKRALATCDTHVKRAQKYGFTVARGHG